MAKYILKESELRAAISEAVSEELGALLNEGLPTALGNTLKYGALGIAAPAILANKAIDKMNGIINGNDTIAGTIRDYFGAKNGSSSSSGNRSNSQTEKYAATRAVSGEYGKPEMVPGFGHKMKLAKKSKMELPKKSKVSWGDFGKHYHDEGNKAWERKVLNTEKSMTRNSGQANARNIRRYKRILVDWLKERDYAYENYVKNL